MGLHFLDATLELRDCPAHWYWGSCELSPNEHPEQCGCHGTGRLGDPEAEPDVEVGWIAGPVCRPESEGWYFNLELDLILNLDCSGPYPTEQAALEAAREAHHAEAG